jgi:hypothetical protein
MEEPLHLPQLFKNGRQQIGRRGRRRRRPSMTQLTLRQQAVLIASLIERTASPSSLHYSKTDGSSCKERAAEEEALHYSKIEEKEGVGN